MTEGTGLSNFQDTVGVWKPSPSPSNMPNKQPCITIYPCKILYKLKFEQKMLHFLVMLKKTLYPCKEANFWIQPNMQKRTQNNLAKTTLKTKHATTKTNTFSWKLRLLKISLVTVSSMINLGSLHLKGQLQNLNLKGAVR